MQRTFKSKIDTWIACIFALSAILIIYTIYVTVNQGELSIAEACVYFLAGIWLPVWFFFGTFYRVDKQHLTIHCAFYKKRILLTDIHSVIPSKSWWASAALSLDRLKITYADNRTILVSPKDKEGFIQALNLN